MKIKISATYEGKCSICKKTALVFSAGDEDTHKTASVCRDCSQKFPNKQISDLIEEYGKEDLDSFKEGMSVNKFGTAG